MVRLQAALSNLCGCNGFNNAQAKVGNVRVLNARVAEATLEPKIDILIISQLFGLVA